MTELVNLLSELARNGFYGCIEVKLEAGKVVLIRKTETLKPRSEDRRDNRGENGNPYQ